MEHASTPAPANEGRLRLASYVQNRRIELGLSVRSAAEASGLARGTWTALEDGSRRTSDSNYAAIEEALCWASGSILTILNGGNPSPAPATGRAAVTTPALTATGTGTVGDNLADDPVMRILNSPAPAEVKQRIVAQLLAEQREFAQRRVAELLRAALPEQAPPAG
jgi:hypothetical protein